MLLSNHLKQIHPSMRRNYVPSSVIQCHIAIVYGVHVYLYCSLFIQCQCYKSQYCIEVITSYSFADISEPIPPLELSPRVVVENSPGLKPGTPVLCERVRIHGLSRIHHLRKLSHSANVKVVSKSSSPLHPTKFEVCFHR